MPQIARLDIRGFRGILNQRSLIFDGKSILLFGENGTGKSSFVDALEWLFTKRMTTLDGRAQELSSLRHGPHIRSSAPPLVSLTFAAPENVTIDSARAPTNLSPSMTQYLDGAKENLYIMRRSQLADFINSPPRDRYSLLRPFIPLGRVEGLEQAFRLTAEITKKDSLDAKYQTQRSVSELSVRFPIPTGAVELSEATFTAAVSKLLGENGLPAIRRAGEIAERIKDLDAILSEFGDLRRQSALLAGIEVLSDLKKAVPEAEIEAALNAVIALREKETREAANFFETVLEQGAKWIQGERRTECPLCEQPIDPERVVSRVRQRLQEMQEIVRLRISARRSIQQASEATRSALRAADKAAEALSSVQEASGEQSIDSFKSTLRDIAEAVQGAAEQVDVAKTRSQLNALSIGSESEKALNALSLKLKETLNALPSQERARTLLALRQKLLDGSRLWLEYGKGLIALHKATLATHAAERIWRNCETARKEVVQSLYNELSGEINRIYLSFHPGERHTGIHLGIREAVQGSAHLRGNFYDRQDEDVRAYYSEAHLDTLGLSIFLALRIWHRRKYPKFDLLVLDDVLTSVDSKHLVRVSELLLREFSDYQILLTTHDRIWFEHLRDIQSRCRVANRFINKIIHKWTIEDGPDLREPEDERRDLGLRLSEGEPKSIASAAGRLLEHTLQEMRYNFRLRIEARRGELYEIGDLWPAFYSEIRKNYTSLYQAAKDSLDALDVQWPLRNWVGAHFNEWAARVSRESSMEFGNAVAKVFDALFCAECRRFVEPSATPLGQVACRCGAKLYPAPGKKGVPPVPRAELVASTRGVLKNAQLDTNVYLELKRAETSTEK